MEHPHHLSVLLGGTFENGEHEDENGITVGLDYEYRLNRLIGIGGVLERAFGSLNATTALAVVDLHPRRGPIVQTGVGVERGAIGNSERVFRVGILYEFERGRLTISPQLHLDVTEDHESLVLALALGRAF